MSSQTFNDTDRLAINTIRTLSADMVQAANSGHPGAPMGCAPMAHVLFSRHLRCNPKNSTWLNRDRFVLSNGHACALQYVLLHLLGYKLSLDDLKQFRQIGSHTPGHPEAADTDGIEVTTGPLGQGFSNAVGLALAEAHMAATFNRDDFPLIDNYTYVILGDGCLQEGIASEAASLAGHLKLGRLIALYDSNGIQIDGDTALSFDEDVNKRFEAYGWHVLSVEDGDNDLDAIDRAITEAKRVTDRPTLINIRTTIGFSAPKAGTEKVHGAPLGDADLATQVSEFYGKLCASGEEREAKWNQLFENYKKSHSEQANDLTRRINKTLPNEWRQLLPTYKPTDSPVATRKLSETVLNHIADKLPELIGGSADLTHSNLTQWKTAVDFQASNSKLGNPAGRYLRFGVREHGMAAILNGISAYGALVPFGATFLNFISYALGAVRLSALSKQRVIYIMTHDSIGLGEDGPTHQPIETLAGLRALPNLHVLRPADGNEVSAAYIAAIESLETPSVICLTRQNVRQLEGSSIDNALHGAYTLAHDANSTPNIILVGTGSEVEICVDAAAELAKQGIVAHVVSMPSWFLFDKQPESYRQSVFPVGVPVLSVEALSTLGWQKYAHAQVGMHTFGTSGPYKQVYAHFGFTAQNVAEKARATVEFYKSTPVPNLVKKPF
ncbi:Transketolase, thiamine diphosphate binding domain-containing protein [Syncephalis plumigaleata]|nr:Transketolase, thiamine diphosphate binding domain-containing protein [Syncephalis plumigaleata]